MSVLAFLGVTRIGPTLWLLAAVATSAGAGGFWAGREWTQGRTAQREVVDLRADATALREAAESLRQNSVATAQDARTAARRMDLIASQHQESLDAIDSLFVVQRDVLDAQLASAAAADLLRCRVGAFGVQIWNDAASGIIPATHATTADSQWFEAAVPSGATPLGGRFWGDADADVPAGRAGVSPLPDAPRRSGQGSERP